MLLLKKVEKNQRGEGLAVETASDPVRRDRSKQPLSYIYKGTSNKFAEKCNTMSLFWQGKL